MSTSSDSSQFMTFFFTTNFKRANMNSAVWHLGLPQDTVNSRTTENVTITVSEYFY